MGLLVYTFSGICAGIAGLIRFEHQSADANNAGLGFGARCHPGRCHRRHIDDRRTFSLLASIIGALAIQSMTTTMCAIGVPAMAAQAVKAVVVDGGDPSTQSNSEQ